MNAHKYSRPVSSQSAADSSVDRVPRRGTRSDAAAIAGWLKKYGLLFTIAFAIIGFGAARPDTFLTWSNFQSIFQEAAPLAIVSSGLTVALVVAQFDLSFGALIGLSGAVAIVLISQHGFPWILAVLIALLVGLVTGLVNGILTAFLGGASFITTLAMGTALTGVQYLITGEATIYENIPHSYDQIGQSTSLFGLSNEVWIALAVALALFLVLEFSEFGRYMYALGSNREAARYSGLHVRSLQLSGFVATGLCAAMVGIILTSQAASSSPDMGTPYLLPAFAAVYLGSAVFHPGRFNIPGTVAAVFFLQILAVGLTLLQLSTAWIDIVQGVVLIVAILLSRLEQA